MPDNANLRVQAKEQSRRLIVRAARELFEAHGFENVTTRQIAKHAGYSTGAIFSHWSGKEDLFFDAMERPYLTDARGAELLARLQEIAPVVADEVLTRWAA